MNTNLLKSRLLTVETAYVLFFILSHYAYLGKWKMQLLYWIIVVGGISLIFPLIWPLNQFFAIPNKVKRHNLKIYEEMLNYKN